VLQVIVCSCKRLINPITNPNPVLVTNTRDNIYIFIYLFIADSGDYVKSMCERVYILGSKRRATEAFLYVEQARMVNIRTCICICICICI
jgi:hypothetical protein